MISEETREKWKTRTSCLIAQGFHGEIALNEWETDFLCNVSRLVDSNKDLSFKQSSTLTKIYNKYIK